MVLIEPVLGKNRGDRQSNKQGRGMESHVGKISYDRERERGWPKEQGRVLENPKYQFL